MFLQLINILVGTFKESLKVQPKVTLMQSQRFWERGLTSPFLLWAHGEEMEAKGHTGNGQSTSAPPAVLTTHQPSGEYSVTTDVRVQGAQQLSR